jgi:hypothetical protein
MIFIIDIDYVYNCHAQNLCQNGIGVDHICLIYVNYNIFCVKVFQLLF